MKRLVLIAVIAVAATLIPARPAAAHGGSDIDLTSDYRTRITEISDIDGLTARVVGLDGTVEITWTGTGTLIVAGYDDEPYLRFDTTGVAVNTRSPAAYLNQDRYANAEVPASVDTAAEPDWQPVTTGHRYAWHDHRTHWMSPVPPPQAQQDPGRGHVIYDRWEIPLTIDDNEALVAGDLTWAPAPTLWPWFTLAALIGIASGVALWTARWREVAAVLAATGTIALTIDTAGFVAEMNDTITNRAWAFNYAIAAALATIRLVVHAVRRSPHPTLAMMIAGLILALMGGFDRFDVLTSGFYQSALDITVARATTVICLGVGIALAARFLWFLVPLVITPQQPHAIADEQPDELPIVAP